MQDKGSNFAGIPKGLLGEIVGLVSGTLQPGLTAADASNVLVHLLWEEHQAANPGADTTGFLEALEVLAELKQAKLKLQTAPAAQVPAAITYLIKTIDDLTALWKQGGVMPGFFTPEH